MGVTLGLLFLRWLRHTKADLAVPYLAPCSVPDTYYGWPTTATATEFWSIIATRYADLPHVFFGLLNEPQGNYGDELTLQYVAAVQVRAQAHWHYSYTAAVQCPHLPLHALHLPLPIPQPIVDAIRATGARNLIAVGAARQWARIADGFVTYPVNDTNWAASIHGYFAQSDFNSGLSYCQVRRQEAYLGCTAFSGLQPTPSMAYTPLQTHACVVEEFGPATGYSLNDVRHSLGCTTLATLVLTAPHCAACRSDCMARLGLLPVLPLTTAACRSAWLLPIHMCSRWRR